MTPQAMAVREAAERVTGARFSIEGTGGGCEVLSARLEGGLVMVISDGNLAADFDYMGARLDVAVYTAGGWDDGGDAIAYIDREPRDAARTVADVLDLAVQTVSAS